jgi:8-oxo-dGTP diphosphatase
MKPGSDYIGIGAGGAIVNENGELFLALRSKNVRNEPEFWEFPGGGVEFGETLESALKREMKEEYRVDIEIIELIGVSDSVLPKEKQHWVSPGYLCKIVKGDPQIVEPEKCEEIGWFSLSEIENLPLNTPTRFELMIIKKRYPEGIKI